MCIKEGDKVKLSIAVWNDSLFLDSLGVMDYSLLVGLDKDKPELVVGIIGNFFGLAWASLAGLLRSTLLKITCASTLWTNGWRS